MRRRDLSRAIRRYFAYWEDRRRVPMRINLHEDHCVASFEGHQLVKARGMYPCSECGSWELCEAECRLAPWNLDARG